MKQYPESNPTPLSTDTIPVDKIKEFILQLDVQFKKLSNLLDSEQQILISGTADDISTVAESKFKLIQELTNYISTYLNREFGLNGNKNLEKMLTIIESACTKNKISEWNELVENIGKCKELNQENSIQLANRLKFTNNAIDTLYMLAGAEQDKTYDPSGVSNNSRSNRQLASV